MKEFQHGKISCIQYPCSFNTKTIHTEVSMPNFAGLSSEDWLKSQSDKQIIINVDKMGKDYSHHCTSV